MTRASAAIATGLPSNRRAFLGNSLALASLLTSAAALPAIAADHPDVEILALGREWEASARREAEAYKIDEAAYRRYVASRPACPEALYARPDELTYLSVVEPEINAEYEPTGRHVWNRAKTPEWCRTAFKNFDDLRACRRLFDRPELSDHEQAELDRMHELLAATEAWDEADARCFKSCGADRASDALAAEEKINRDLVWRIVRTPAHTLDGIFLKARAILWTQHDTAAGLEGVWQDTLAHDPGEEEQPAALVLDLLRVSGASHAVPSLVRA